MRSGRWHTWLLYGLATLCYAFPPAAYLWTDIRVDVKGVLSLLAIPAMALGFLLKGWSSLGILLTIFAASALFYARFTPFPDDLGRVGIFTLALVVYGPFIASAYMLGKLLRWATRRLRANVGLPRPRAQRP